MGVRTSGSFKKGQPGKRPVGITNVLQNAGFTREMVERKVTDILLMNSEETREFKTEKKTSNFDLIVIAVVEAAQRNADCSRLDNLLEKIFGKTVKIEGSIKVESDNTNTNLNLLPPADGELMQRAIERALTKRYTTDS